MPEIVSVPLSDLLVDVRNARLKDEQPSQASAILALAGQQGSRLLKIAAHIVEKGLSPLELVGVVATSDQKKRYVVVEGNRRVVALKALETPSLVAPAFDSRGNKRLNAFAQKFAKEPITNVPCVLFGSEGEAARWVTLRHTGQNEGVGLVEWGSDEKDRWAARHGERSPEGKILDFLEANGGLPVGNGKARDGVITNLKRLLSTPHARERLGVTISGGEVLALHPHDEVKKALRYVVEEFASKRATVKDIYHAKDRIAFANAIPKTVLPDPSSRFAVPASLGAVGSPTSSGTAVGKPSTKAKGKNVKKLPMDRTTLIPKTCHLDIDSPRINAIYTELLQLNVDVFPNACAVVMRVLVELSVDHVIEQRKLMDENTRLIKPLAKRMKAVAGALAAKDGMPVQLETAVTKIADAKFVLCASTPTFNQYVHNKYVFVKPTELRVAWDELQPFMEWIWK